ncbi:hypothetical protein [Candidatus Phyllobacterium onerii]|uniref:hypothetical protein n=1 Tax=Candidatus Phyllobacterium onerii TaxID=3020828 RepID=UPI00232B77B5|nr:hypothetical protein [Phyllobacterium sp. IY22]
MNWAAQRQEFMDEIKKFKELLDPLVNGNVRLYRAEGNDPRVDITDEMRVDYETNIRNYQRLIEIVDEQVASGR